MFCARKPDYCKMSAAVLELPYLPNISWFKNYVRYEQIWIEQHENFVKSGSRNRCRIAGANGLQTLTIPLQGGRDHHRLYTNTQIAYHSDWQKNHWHSIRSAYGSAPYFEFYAHLFQKFYEKQYPLLFDFNLELLRATLAALKMKKGFEFTTVYENKFDDKTDLRSQRNASTETPNLPRYYQVFEERNGFIADLSVLDLIFNLGPQSSDYLRLG